MVYVTQQTSGVVHAVETFDYTLQYISKYNISKNMFCGDHKVKCIYIYADIRLKRTTKYVIILDSYHTLSYSHIQYLYIHIK